MALGHPRDLTFDTSLRGNSVYVLDDAFSLGVAGNSCPQDGSGFMVRYRASPSAVTY